MAKLNSSFSFTGALDGYVAYKLPGVSGTVLRRKGGVPGHVIKTAPKYENTRRNNVEFGGRSEACGWIMRMMNPVNRLANFPFGGALNALLKPVQELDTESEFGKRHVMLSRNRNLLKGFSLNEEYPFSYVVRSAPEWSITRSELSATVRLHGFVPQINFFPSPLAPFYSVVAVLGLVPDLFHSAGRYEPSHPDYSKIAPVMTVSNWQSCTAESNQTELGLQISAPPDENFSLILSIGIRYGIPAAGLTIRQKEKSGCGVILSVA